MMTIGSLFSGIGGLELGLERALGAETIWQVEQDDYCRRVLAKHWPAADRSITDVCEAGAGNLIKPDLICGGFPCQGISVAGLRRGLEDERSKLWWEFYRILGELRPSIVVLENVPAIVAAGIAGVVIGKLSEIGYDCEWQIISAKQMGAPHIRRRWFCIGYLSDSERFQLWDEPRRSRWEDWSDSDESSNHGKAECLAGRTSGDAWPSQSRVFRVAHGVSNRMDRLRALGNAVVPACSYEVGLRIRDVVCPCTSES